MASCWSAAVRDPCRAPSATVDATPRTEGLTAERSGAETRARAAPTRRPNLGPFRSWEPRGGCAAPPVCRLGASAPLFAFIIEAIGYRPEISIKAGWRSEFHGATIVSFSLTATFGAFLTFMLVVSIRSSPLYFSQRPASFTPTTLGCQILIQSRPAVGLQSIIRTAVIVPIANAWLTFMMSHGDFPTRERFSPSGTRSPTCIASHRERPRSADRFSRRLRGLATIPGERERAHWMGYIGNLVPQ